MNFSYFYENATAANGFSSVPMATTGAAVLRVPRTSARNYTRTPLMAVLSAVAVCANLLVMICVVRDKKLRRPANYYVFSLAVNEFIIALIPVNGLLVYDAFGYWPLGRVACKIWSWIDYSTASVSMLHMTLLAYDRFQAIVYPLRYSRANKLHWIATRIAVVYVASFALWLPIVIIFISTSSRTFSCQFETNPFFTVLIFFTNIIPICSMTFMYVRCVDALRRQFRRMHPAVVVNVLAQQQQQQQQQHEEPLTTSRLGPAGWNRVWNAVRDYRRSLTHPSSSGTKDTAFSDDGHLAAARISTGFANSKMITMTESGSSSSTTVNGSINKLAPSSSSPAPPAAAAAAAASSSEHRPAQSTTRCAKPTATESHHHQDHQRSVRGLAFILGSYLILITPMTGCTTYLFLTGHDVCINRSFEWYTDWSPYFICAVNPLVVMLVQKDFRVALQALFGRCESGQ